MSYVDEVYGKIVNDNPEQKEFHQAVKEWLESVRVVVEADENKYKKDALLERMIIPDRQICFRVNWMDDQGNIQTNNGWRIQNNNAIGPYKGGLRFHPTVTQGMIKFLGFEMVYKNALTGLPIGGGKGGSDFDPKGKSERDEMRFCQAFTRELFKYVGADIDVPAGDIGVGGREIGYMTGEYKRLTNTYDGTFTGKGVGFGGSLARTEATGYGLLYFTEAMLKDHGTSIRGKRVAVSGAGNVAVYAIEKAHDLGANVVTCSDSTGWIYDPAGIDVELLKKVKFEQRARLTAYQHERPHAEYHEGKGVFSVKADIILPCATQNEIDMDAAMAMVRNGVYAVVEGANMPTTLDATKYLQDNGVILIPSKASNAGGVATSQFEMCQNSERTKWTFEEVDAKLKRTMETIYHNIAAATKEYGMGNNYVAGANLAAFKTISEAMIAQGI